MTTYKLNSNSWHLKMNRVVYGENYRPLNFCPYFWLSFVALLIFIPVLIVRLCIKIHLSMKNFTDNIKYKKQDDNLQKLINLPINQFITKMLSFGDNRKYYSVYGIGKYDIIRLFSSKFIETNIDNWYDDIIYIHKKNEFKFDANVSIDFQYNSRLLISFIYDIINYIDMEEYGVKQESKFSKKLINMTSIIDKFFENIKNKITSISVLMKIGQLIGGGLMGTILLVIIYGIYYILNIPSANDYLTTLGYILCASGLFSIGYGIWVLLYVIYIHIINQTTSYNIKPTNFNIKDKLNNILAILLVPFILIKKIFNFLMSNYCPGIDWEN
jgi:hypothetical protein